MGNDFISRKEALEAVMKVPVHDVIKEEGHIFVTQKSTDVVDALYHVKPIDIGQAIEILLEAGWLEEHDHVITTNWWVPVEEGLPLKDGKFLVTLHTYGNLGFPVNDYEIKILRFVKGSWRLPIHSPKWIDETLKQEVVAWMPLPHLYKRLYPCGEKNESIL